MNSNAKTIQVFLPDGEPRGLRIAEITTRIAQAVAVPRTDLAKAFARPESDHVAVYFLFGTKEDVSKDVVYIGQTESLVERLKDHNSKKDFWQTAVFLISRTHTFTQAHIRYLEWYAIKEAQKAGRYVLDNGNAGGEPHVTEPMKADIMDAFETGKMLLGMLGYPVFEPLVEPAKANDKAEVFYLKGIDTEATGELVQDGFVVFKGSKGRVETKPSVAAYVTNRRNELLAEGTLVEEDGRLVLTEDLLFKSPSGAADTFLGNSSNGWTAWKDASGKTLHDAKRAGTTEA